MRTIRNIGGGVILAIGAALVCAVVWNWYDKGCDDTSAIVGAAIYGAAVIAAVCVYFKVTQGLADDE